MNWYKLSQTDSKSNQEKYIIDDSLLRGINDWLYRVVRPEEVDMAREKMLMWIESVEKYEAEYALEIGFRKVFDLASEKYDGL